MNKNGIILANAIKSASYVTIELPTGERIRLGDSALKEIAMAVERSLRMAKSPARKKTPEERMRELQRLVRNL